MLDVLKLFVCGICANFACATLVAETTSVNIETKITEAIESVEKKSLDYQVRALELSLYYQGFDSNIIGNYDIYGAYDELFKNLPTDEDLKNSITTRDAKKAFKYALIAFENDKFVTFASSNLANLYLCGIGTEKNIAKAYEVLSDCKLFKKPISEIQRYEGGMYRFDSFKYFQPLIAYMCYNGLGVEKDLARCDAILKEILGDYAWRNFYCGFMVPKDFDFAIYCLERRKDFWAAQILADIYSGKYSPKDSNKEKAAHWAKIAQERTPDFAEEMKKYYARNIEREKTNASRISANINLALYYGFKHARVSQKYKYNNMPFENPFYDLQKALKALEEFEREAFNKPEESKYLLQELEYASNADRNYIWGRNVEYDGEIFEDFKKLYEKYKKLAKENQPPFK